MKKRKLILIIMIVLYPLFLLVLSQYRSMTEKIFLYDIETGNIISDAINRAFFLSGNNTIPGHVYPNENFLDMSECKDYECLKKYRTYNNYNTYSIAFPAGKFSKFELFFSKYVLVMLYGPFGEAIGVSGDVVVYIEGELLENPATKDIIIDAYNNPCDYLYEHSDTMYRDGKAIVNECLVSNRDISRIKIESFNFGCDKK